jgi:hypothetical protein
MAEQRTCRIKRDLITDHQLPIVAATFASGIVSPMDDQRRMTGLPAAADHHSFHAS